MTAARDWPYLMRLSTARAYLDGMSLARFAALVAPHLETRIVGDEVRYTRHSLDAWIDAGGRPGNLETPSDLARALQQDGNDDDQDRRRQRLRQ